jgi:flagellar L-ring protein precursor FlgH
MKRYLVLPLLLLPACERLGEVGRAPDFTPTDTTAQHLAIYAIPMPDEERPRGPSDAASLWTGERTSLLGDTRAARRGDILTVVIEIDDRAEISNATGRNRTANQTMGIPQFFGLPQRIDEGRPEGSSMAEAVETGSASTFSGDGSVRRREKLALRIAATVVDQLPNGVLRIEGQQEVRVNYELRELVVTGYVRPADISRRNEVGYDKIAGARISYGGRGQISDVQQPRIGQQITDLVLPF